LFCLVPQPIFKSKNLFNQLFFIKSNAPFIYLFFLSNLVLATVHKPFKYVSLYYLVEKKIKELDPLLQNCLILSPSLNISHWMNLTVDIIKDKITQNHICCLLPKHLLILK
jgi:hypothetical protein